MANKQVEKQITAQNQFSDAYKFRPPGGGVPERASLKIAGAAGAGFTATVVIQAKDPADADTEYETIDSYTTGQRKTLEFYDDVDVRIGVKTGAFTTGPINTAIRGKI